VPSPNQFHHFSSFYKVTIVKLRTFSSFLALVLLFSATASTIYALPSLQQAQVSVAVAETANLRAGPGTKYARVGGVTAGDSVAVVGCNADCSWYKTASGAWIAAELLVRPPTALPHLATDADATITPTLGTAEQQEPVANTNANLRSGPGTNFPRVGSVKAGDPLALTGQNPAGDWLQLAGEHWIAAFLVDNITDGLPIVEDLPEQPAAATAQPAESPAATPAPAAGPTQVAAKPELVVEFINPHYNCEFGEYTYEIVDGAEQKIWAYRSFQIDMFVTNNGSEPIAPPWQPTRWIITDGQHEMINDLTWQWVKRNTGAYDQPTIYPGQTAGWTWVAMPVGEYEWVKAVEYYHNGQIYRQEFDLGPYHNAYNYIKCNDYVPAHKEYPTPTPVPLWDD
jgi:uncharacterized protein YraI